MERHIGIWHQELYPQKAEIGELLIDGNRIEFYGRFHGCLFPCTFIGEDKQYRYKVFVNGCANPGKNRVLENSTTYSVSYVLMPHFEFSKGTDISGIKNFSFTFPELQDWIGINTVFYYSTEQNEPAAGEYQLDPIIIKESNPHIELYFDSRTRENILTSEDDTTITVKKEPRIRVIYDRSENVQTICSDIECLMQFFGLLIGKVSTVEDIRLSVEGQESRSWLYINYDYSYNLINQNVLDKPRTYYYVVAENLIKYYSNWNDFFSNDQYSLLRRIYFSVNKNKEVLMEDVFVEYIRILDGYHTRAFGDADKEMKLKEALKEAEKIIRSQLFTNENKPVFEEPIQKIIPNWMYDPSHIEDIAGWIAAGYVSKKSLSHRLRELDKNYFEIIKNNALQVQTHSQAVKDNENMTKKQIISLYYKELSDTRNYYSHYKQDKTGVLNFVQILASINILKSMIIAIFLSQMKIDKNIVRKMLAFDSELWPQTQFLREENEKPFLNPKEWITIQREYADF